jgi:endogenous inhibitor of DNA gyrase (YacG/DUF329 family)
MSAVHGAPTRWLVPALLLAASGCTLRSANVTPTTESGAVAATRPCPNCGQASTPTDSTKTQWAKVYRLFRCPVGHQEWAVAFETRRVNQVVVSDPCPSCGSQLTWTGESNGAGEGQVRVMRCESGHSVTRRQ